jgi:hypothetical protein
MHGQQNIKQKVNPFPPSKLDFQNDSEKAILNGRRYLKLEKKMETEYCKPGQPQLSRSAFLPTQQQMLQQPMRFF